jgi:hypothetical protein
MAKWPFGPDFPVFPDAVLKKGAWNPVSLVFRGPRVTGVR